ncbi:MAG TPA: AmmeMemoRadiSam system protein A [Myxococcota bacterium]|nr:AmmeMemoRadiSam system protein A [Myxococcota bacterium]
MGPSPSADSKRRNGARSEAQPSEDRTGSEPARSSADLAALSEGERDALRGVALRAVEGAAHGADPPDVDPGAHAPRLRAPGASFVTLRREGELRGCVGRLEAVEPLVRDVARSAHRAACADTRFERVLAHELAALELKISVLSSLEPLRVTSEADLLAALRPGIDGLVLREGLRGATFLPAVWESLLAPEAFLRELLRKAGLPERYWSPTLRFERYTSLEF